MASQVVPTHHPVSDSWQVLCFSRGLTTVPRHGEELCFVSKVRVWRTEELPGVRPVHPERGATAQQRKVLRIGSSRQLLCMFLLRNKGGRVDLESLGGASEHSSALSSAVGPVLFTQGTCGGRWRTFCCMQNRPGQV